MMCKFFLFMVLCVMCACALPESPSTSLQVVGKRETSQRYCGGYLVSILQFVCDSKYHGEEEKRSSEDKSLRDMEWMSQPSDYALEVEFPFLSRPLANSLTNKLFRRHTRTGAIVDECCIYKGCTISELTEYCQMWRLCFRLIVVLAMCCSLSESQSDVYQFMDKRQNKRYCGRNLVEILQLVCNGSYNGISTSNTNYNHKKSIEEMDEDFWQQLQPAEEVYKFPFRSRASAFRIYKRYPSGIAYECCISKGCSVLELRSYCAPITS